MQNLNGLIGMKTERRVLEYTWRDMALYALAVGAKAEDLAYTYERNMKALPSYGVVPYWGAVGIEPRLPRPEPASQLADAIIKSTMAPLHMDHELQIHRPIDPIKGTFVFQDIITDVYDRGERKGGVIKTRAEVYDEGGNLVCTNIASTLYQEGGGFGGPPMPKSSVVIPEREPDILVDDQIGPVQNVLYRLTGDTNLVHVDPDYAREQGFDRVFMQGLCSFGFACRMAIGALIPYEPERVTRMAAQMRSILYMDTPIQLALWKTREGEACFRLINMKTNKPILERGIFNWI